MGKNLGLGSGLGVGFRTSASSFGFHPCFLTNLCSYIAGEPNPSVRMYSRAASLESLNADTQAARQVQGKLCKS